MHESLLVILFIGAVVGFLSGLFGKGGSAITTPALQVFGKVNPFAALASPLPATLITTLSASFAYRHKHLIDTKVVLVTILMGIPATLAGSFCSSYVKGNVLMLMTALFVLTLGVSFFFPSKINNDPESLFFVPFWKIATVALSVGFLSGLLANSGGVLFGPLFIRFLKLPLKKALPCSLLVSAGLSIPGTLAHWYLGHIDWSIVLMLSLGSLPFSYVGARLAMNMRNKQLEKLFATMLVLFGAFDFFYSLANYK